MRKTALLPILGILILFMTIPALADQKPKIDWEKKFGGWVATVTYTADVGNGGSLRIKDVVGNITINGRSSKNATIVYELKINDGMSQGAAEKILQELIPEFKTAGDRITVFGPKRHHRNYHDISMSLSADLPSKFDINGSTGGGSISVNGIEGIVDMSSGGGTITVEQCKGEVDVSTGGGNIDLNHIAGAIDVSTGGGSIDLESLDLDSRGRISTGGGGIDLIETSGSLTISTGAGNIRARGHKGDLRISTGAGNIDTRDVHGSLSVGTGAGSVDVDVPMDKQASSWALDVNTGAGSIDLRLPGKLPMTVHATVENARSKHDIRSDFDLDISDHRWDGISATGKINGGGMTINVNSGRGKISLRKI